MVMVVVDAWEIGLEDTRGGVLEKLFLPMCLFTGEACTPGHHNTPLLFLLLLLSATIFASSLLTEYHPVFAGW